MKNKVRHKGDKRVVIFFIATLLILLSSCNKRESYPFRIINNSNYDITRLSFSGAVNGDEITLNANDMSDNMTLSYQKRIRLTPKLICLSIDEFEDPNSNFNVIYSRACLPFSKKDLNGEMNTITVTSLESSDTITFEITLN